MPRKAWVIMKITNYNTQITDKSQYQNYNKQTFESVCNFGIVYCVLFVICPLFIVI